MKLKSLGPGEQHISYGVVRIARYVTSPHGYLTFTSYRLHHYPELVTYLCLSSGVRLVQRDDG